MDDAEYARRKAAIAREQAEEAVRTLNESINVSGKENAVLEWLFLAMAHHSLVEAGSAKTYLERASRWIGQNMTKDAGAAPGATGLSWSNRLEIALLHREAEAFVNMQGP